MFSKLWPHQNSQFAGGQYHHTIDDRYSKSPGACLVQESRPSLYCMTASDHFTFKTLSVFRRRGPPACSLPKCGGMLLLGRKARSFSSYVRCGACKHPQSEQAPEERPRPTTWQLRRTTRPHHTPTARQAASVRARSAKRRWRMQLLWRRTPRSRSSRCCPATAALPGARSSRSLCIARLWAPLPSAVAQARRQKLC